MPAASSMAVLVNAVTLLTTAVLGEAFASSKAHISVGPRGVSAGLRNGLKRSRVVRRAVDDTISEASLDLTEAQQEQVHCVFVTSCDTTSHKADVLLYSAFRVKQPGPITHIVYGCNPAQEKTLQRRNDAMFPQTEGGPEFFFHHAPVSAPKGSSRAMPKVLGVEHWVANGGPRRNFVAILDDDFIFMAPLTRQLPRDNYGDAWHFYEDHPAVVSKGVTMAAHYHGFLPDNKGRKEKYLIRSDDGGKESFYDPGDICRGDSLKTTPCDNLTKEDISDHSVGPPYMIETSDLRNVAPSWATFSLRLARAGDGFHADMHGWMLAVVYHKLRQIRHDMLMMSSSASGGEKWGFVDGEYPLECAAPPTWKNQQLHTSIFLHYCQHYKVGDLDLYKGESQKASVPYMTNFISKGCNSSEQIPLPALEAQGKKKKERRNFFGYCSLATTLQEVIQWKCERGL